MESPNQAKVRRQRERNAKHPDRYIKKRQKRDADPEYTKGVVSRIRERRLADPSYYLWSKARTRARKSGLPFDITPEDVIIPKLCPILKQPLVVLSGGPYSPSLDRIKPKLGYVRGNVCVISHRANSIKRDATKEEILLMAQWFRKQQ